MGIIKNIPSRNAETYSEENNWQILLSIILQFEQSKIKNSISFIIIFKISKLLKLFE